MSYLENGMKVYPHRLPNIKILTAGLIVHHGSINEKEAKESTITPVLCELAKIYLDSETR